MKHKLFKPILAAILVLTLAVSFAACSSKDKDGNSDSSDIKPNIVETEPEFDTIDAFLQDETVSKQINSVLAEQKDTQINVKAEGSKLVYEYTLDEGQNTEEFKKELENTTKMQEYTFTNIATALSEAIREDNPSVVVRYLDANGSLIFEKEFTPETETEE